MDWGLSLNPGKNIIKTENENVNCLFKQIIKKVLTCLNKCVIKGLDNMFKQALEVNGGRTIWEDMQRM